MIVNDCNFVGNLTRDPEFRRTNTGKAVANFSVAVNGWKKDDVRYVDFEAWERDAEFMSKNCAKGDMVIVKSEYRLDEFTDKDGNKRSKPRFRVVEVKKCWAPKGDARPKDDEDVEDDDGGDDAEGEDDDIPF